MEIDFYEGDLLLIETLSSAFTDIKYFYSLGVLCFMVADKDSYSVV